MTFHCQGQLASLEAASCCPSRFGIISNNCEWILLWYLSSSVMNLTKDKQVMFANHSGSKKLKFLDEWVKACWAGEPVTFMSHPYLELFSTCLFMYAIIPLMRRSPPKFIHPYVCMKLTPTFSMELSSPRERITLWTTVLWLSLGQSSWVPIVLLNRIGEEAVVRE